MRNDVIEVRGARENNLAGVDLDVPKWTLVVFTGVSGWGKSSLVFGTIAAESQRLINETYTAFLQSLMPALPRPDVARISGLNAVIVVDQERMGANSRSTVGTATDTWTMLRVLFARAGSPAVPGPSALSFNDPTGMCPACEGIGTVATMNVDAVLDRSLSLNAGAITFPNFAVGSLFWQIFADSGYFDLDTPIAKWSQAELDQLLTGTGGKVGTGSYKLSYEGLLDKIKRLYLSKDRDALQPHIRKALDGAAAVAVCSGCEGTRLNDASRACILGGRSIAGCNGMQVDDLAAWARTLNHPRIAPLVGGLVSTLDNLVEIGLGYLSLDRPTGTLSGGEAQRVKMVRHLDSSLNEMTYAFDEPTGGLHAHDTERTIGLLRRLRDKGNTVLVVEHDPDVIAAADHVVDLGPGAGTAGGHVVYQGDVEGLRRSGSLTGHHLDVRQPHPCPAANPDRSPVHRGCDGQQPAWGQRRRPARCADGRDRGRRIGQELADPRCATTPGRPGGGRPVPNQGVPTLQPRHLLRGPRRHPGRLRQGKRRQGRAVQRQLRWGMPGLQRPWRHLHRSRLHARRHQHMRGLRWPQVHP